MPNFLCFFNDALDFGDGTPTVADDGGFTVALAGVVGDGALEFDPSRFDWAAANTPGGSCGACTVVYVRCLARAALRSTFSDIMPRFATNSREMHNNQCPPGS